MQYSQPKVNNRVRLLVCWHKDTKEQLQTIDPAKKTNPDMYPIKNDDFRLAPDSRAINKGINATPRQRKEIESRKTTKQ